MLDMIRRVVKCITVTAVGTTLPALTFGALVGVAFKNCPYEVFWQLKTFWPWVIVVTPAILLFALLDGVAVRICHRYLDLMTNYRLSDRKERLSLRDWRELMKYGWTSTEKKLVSWGPWYWSYHNYYQQQQIMNHHKKH